MDITAMFERFTDSASRTLFFGREEMTRHGGAVIELDDLCLGLLRQPDGVVADVLSAAQVPADLVRDEIEREGANHRSVRDHLTTRFSVPAQALLQFAAEEADRLQHADIAPEHLLLGLLREGRSTAASVLARHGLDLRAGRTAVAEFRTQRASHPDAPDDAQALHAIRERLEAAENDFDPNPITAKMADDLVLMVPNEPVQEGKEACAAFIRRVLADLQAWCDRHISYVSDDVSIRGELAFDRGTFSFTVVGKQDGRKTEVTGKYFWLYARDLDAEWKLARIIVSLDDPPES